MQSKSIAAVLKTNTYFIWLAMGAPPLNAHRNESLNWIGQTHNRRRPRINFDCALALMYLLTSVCVVLAFCSSAISCLSSPLPVVGLVHFALNKLSLQAIRECIYLIRFAADNQRLIFWRFVEKRCRQWSIDQWMHHWHWFNVLRQWRCPSKCSDKCESIYLPSIWTTLRVTYSAMFSCRCLYSKWFAQWQTKNYWNISVESVCRQRKLIRFLQTHYPL